MPSGMFRANFFSFVISIYEDIFIYQSPPPVKTLVLPSGRPGVPGPVQARELGLESRHARSNRPYFDYPCPALVGRRVLRPAAAGPGSDTGRPALSRRCARDRPARRGPAGPDDARGEVPPAVHGRRRSRRRDGRLEGGHLRAPGPERRRTPGARPKSSTRSRSSSSRRRGSGSRSSRSRRPCTASSRRGRPRSPRRSAWRRRGTSISWPASPAPSAAETRSRGIRQVLSPVINIARDVRWGRVEETYGEDPLLASRMAVAFVRAFETRGVIATPKHFVANVGAGGRDSYPIADGERGSAGDRLPAVPGRDRRGRGPVDHDRLQFVGRACPARPTPGSSRGILKGEWGFRGFVISDACSVGGSFSLHLTADSYPRVGAPGLGRAASTSSSRPRSGTRRCSARPSSAGRSAATRIDDAVRRVLRAKMELGLFEDPYVDPAEAERMNGRAAHRELARKAARDSVVLLKNDGGSLPVKRRRRRSRSRSSARTRSRRGSAATAGRASARSPSSTRIREQGRGVRGRRPLRRGLRPAGRRRRERRFRGGGPARPRVGPGHRRGRDRGGRRPGTGPISGCPGRQARDDPAGGGDGDADRRRHLRRERGRHVRMARGRGRRPHGLVSRRGGRRRRRRRPVGGRRARRDGCPSPFRSGGRTASARLQPQADGPVRRLPRPSGRAALPVRIRSELHRVRVLGSEDRSRGDRARRDGPRRRARSRTPGRGAGAEVVQLYLHDVLASVVRPVLELKGFRKVFLEPGASATVSFDLGPKELALLDAAMKESVEPGEFEILSGAPAAGHPPQGRLDSVQNEEVRFPLYSSATEPSIRFWAFFSA